MWNERIPRSIPCFPMATAMTKALTAVTIMVMITNVRAEFPTLMEKVLRAAVLEPTRGRHNPSPRMGEVFKFPVWIVPKRWQS